MSEYWTIGPAAPSLGARAFSPQEAQRLVLLKVRYERGAFREGATEQRRLFLVRWLFRHSRRSDLIVPPGKRAKKGVLIDD